MDGDGDGGAENGSQTAVSYIDGDGESQNCETYTPVTSSDSNVTIGMSNQTTWYVVNENVTISGKLTITGNVNLILCDDQTLTVTGGVEGGDSATLTIYGQTEGTGTLKVSGNACDTNIGIAIYMSGSHSNNRSLIINGGVVTAELISTETDQFSQLYGIYTQYQLIVNGGTVTATAKQSATGTTKVNVIAGINACGAMAVNDGKVTATAGAINYAYPENGSYGNSSTGLQADKELYVYGGEVNATGGKVTVHGTAANFPGAGTVVASYGVYAKQGITVNKKSSVLNAESDTVSVNVTDGGASQATIRSNGICQQKTSSDALTVTGGGKVIAAGTGNSYDIDWTGSMTVSAVTSRDNGGTVQNTASGGAVKVWVNGSLTANGTIQLAENSRINGSISASDEAQFNALPDGGCWYFEADDTNSTQITNIDSNTLSAESGKYILIQKSNGVVPYLGVDGRTGNCVGPTELTNSTTWGTSGKTTWYVVKTDLTISNTVTVGGEVHLILCDGKTLTLSGGLESSKNLHIYGQSEGENVGQLVVSGSVAAGNNGVAAISMSGNLEINSGKVTATGNNASTGDSFGIYQKDPTASVSLTVNGGTLEATGGEAQNSYGIYQNTSGNLTVNGGKVTATGGTATGSATIESYGIYKTASGNQGNILIKGGTVVAEGGTATATTGNSSSYGIYARKDVTVSGGELTAEGGKDTQNSYGVYLYNSDNNKTMSMTVSGGELTATGGTAASISYGIYMQSACNTTVTGGTLKATGGAAKQSFGIYLNSSGNFTVSGEGKLTAEGGEATVNGYSGYSVGICSSVSGSHSVKVKDGGTLTAAGKAVSNVNSATSAGIYLKGYAITVENGGKLTATGGDSAGTSEAESYGILCASLTVSGTGTKVTAKRGTATATADNGEAKSYDIDSIMNVSSGTVQSDENGAAVLVCANSESDDSLTVSGGAIKLAENSVMTKVSVSGSVKLLDLLNAEHAYWKITEEKFAESANVTSLIDVIVKLCEEYSAKYGTCAYCGRDLGPAPSAPSVPSNPGSTTVTVPVSSDKGSVNVKAEVSQEGTATVEISDKQIETVIADGAGTVTVDVSGLKDVESVQVPSHVVETTNKAVDTGLTVSLPTGSVSLDETALESVTDNAGGKDITVSVKEVPATDLTEAQQKAVGDMANIGLVVDVDLLVGGEKQSAFNGGKLTISVPYTPKRGEDVSRLTVWFIRDDGTIENKGGWYDAERGCFVFETGHLSRYLLVSVNVSFSDVPAEAYYASAVNWAVARNITEGIGGGLFGPDRTCTREQIVTLLYRCAIAQGVDVSVGADTNILSYTDALDIPAYAVEAFQWACGAGVIQGSAGKLMPNDDCTRSQIVTMLWRYAVNTGKDVSVGADTNILSYSDALDVPAYAVEAFQWACGAGIIQGSAGKLMPNDSCTRAQIVTMLYRLLG